MKYVAHRDYSGMTLDSSKVTVKIPKGTSLECKDRLIWYDGVAVCMKDSYTGHRHFARDDDGRGLERGELTYKLAYAPRIIEGTGYRFTDEERKMISEKYSRWLKPKLCAILFNDNFFSADVDELKKFAERIFGGD